MKIADPRNEAEALDQEILEFRPVVFFLPRLTRREEVLNGDIDIDLQPTVSRIYAALADDEPVEGFDEENEGAREGGFWYIGTTSMAAAPF